LPLALCLLGCQTAPAPHLLQVTGISSDRIAEGDMLELRGTGFPEGRPARVTLRGELYRPGRPPERHFELVLPARSSSPHTVAAEVTRDVERAFVGVVAEHTTFRGNIEAAFFPTSPGMPPVTGGLSAAVIDVVPVGAGPTDAELAEARRFAEFAGVLVSDGASLVVDGVMPKSRAERAGVARGDKFSELAGVRVLDWGDLVPPPHARQVELVVHRNGVADPVHLVLETDGFTRMVPRDLAVTSAIVVAALALFASLWSPLGRALSFFELRLIELLRSRRERVQARAFERARHPEPGFLHATLPSSRAAYLALAAATGVSVFLAIGGSLVAREVDLAVLLVASIVATAVTALVFGAPGERGALARLGRVGSTLAQALPLVAALACAAIESGGVGVDELARAQGALPWQWHALRGPALLAAAVVFVLALVPEASRGTRDAASSRQSAKPSLAGAAHELVGWTHLVIACGVGSFAFLGGARAATVAVVPGTSLAVALAAAALAASKTLGLVLLVVLLRAVIGRLDVREARALTFRILVPVAAAAAAVTLCLQRADLRPITGPLAATLGVSCFVGVALVAAAFARRVVTGTLGRDAEPGVNPWI
jgi:NADH-quinone oxidoreductase subunit H